jgi:hypothetical protein
MIILWSDYYFINVFIFVSVHLLDHFKSTSILLLVHLPFPPECPVP